MQKTNQYLKKDPGIDRINRARLINNQAIYTARFNLRKSTKFLVTNIKKRD
jgi:hypothetical protein